MKNVVFQTKLPRQVDLVVGIDQTSRPRPLPFVALRRKGNGWVLESGALRQFSPEGFEACGVPVRTSRTWITADCVLWPLLGTGERGMWKTFGEASRFSGAASRFFRDHRGARDFRKADLLARAQSVFRELPYQRNIQSGTFRIWSGLGGAPWLNVWPFCERAHPRRAWLAEGYPSLFWRSVLLQKKRDPAMLSPWIRARWGRLIRVERGTEERLLDPDFADAAVLCLCSFELLADQKSMIAKRRDYPQEEGWIFGLSGGMNPVGSRGRGLSPGVKFVV
jgi:hypothetical protein